MALQRGFLMRAFHSISSLITHVRGLSSVSSIASSLCTNHLPTILHTDNVNVVLVWAVWVDWRKRLGTTVGRRRATMASTLDLHMPLGASRSRVPLPVLYTLALREVGCVGTVLWVFISNTRRSEHVLWCCARAMTSELIISLVAPQISFIFDLDRDALFMPHAGTPLSAWMLTILLIQQCHGRAIWPYFNSCVSQSASQMVVLPLPDRYFFLVLQNCVLDRFVDLLCSKHEPLGQKDVKKL